MTFVDYGTYKLAIKIADRGIRFQGYAKAFARVSFGLLIPKFRRNRRGLRLSEQRVMACWKRWQVATGEFSRLRPPTPPEHDEPVQRASEGEMLRPTERKPGAR